MALIGHLQTHGRRHLRRRNLHPHHPAQSPVRPGRRRERQGSRPQGLRRIRRTRCRLAENQPRRRHLLHRPAGRSILHRPRSGPAWSRASRRQEYTTSSGIARPKPPQRRPDPPTTPRSGGAFALGYQRYSGSNRISRQVMMAYQTRIVGPSPSVTIPRAENKLPPIGDGRFSTESLNVPFPDRRGLARASRHGGRFRRSCSKRRVKASFLRLVMLIVHRVRGIAHGVGEAFGGSSAGSYMAKAWGLQTFRQAARQSLQDRNPRYGVSTMLSWF